MRSAIHVVVIINFGKIIRTMVRCTGPLRRCRLSHKRARFNPLIIRDKRQKRRRVVRTRSGIIS